MKSTILCIFIFVAVSALQSAEPNMELPLPAKYRALHETIKRIEDSNLISPEAKNKLKQQASQFEKDFSVVWAPLRDVYRDGLEKLRQLDGKQAQWEKDNAVHSAKPHTFKLPEQQSEADIYNAEKAELETRASLLAAERETAKKSAREQYAFHAKLVADWLAGSVPAFYQTAAGTLTPEIDTKLSLINGRIEKTRDEIRKYNERLKDFEASLEEWSALPQEAREKAIETAKETVATVLLESMTARKEHAIELNEESLRKIQNLLRKRVQIDDLYAQVLTDRAIDLLKTDRDVLTVLNVVKDGLGTASKIPAKDREGALTVLLKTVGMVNSATHGKPEIGLLIADGELAIADLYAWKAGREARERIDQLLNVGDQQLVALKSLTGLYKKDIDNRKSLQEMRASLKSL